MFLDKIISILAPTRCVKCQKVGDIICKNCSQLIDFTPSRCYRCHRASMQHQVCPKCRSATKLKHVWVVANYTDLSKDLLHDLKFARASYIAKSLAKSMSEILPILPSDTIITYVPTAPKRTRVRGYDQSMLIAKELSEITSLELQHVFKRLNNSRQLGSSRKARFEQAGTAYELKNKQNIKKLNYLVVDDVLTSGATIETLAKILKQNGAKSVDAVVFAQAID